MLPHEMNRIMLLHDGVNACNGESADRGCQKLPVE